MKKIFSLLLVVALLASVWMPVSASDNQAKLIYSYEESFEAKDKSIFSGSMRKGYSYSEDYTRTGNVSLKAIGSDEQSGGWLWINNTVAFEKGKTYSLRFFAMAETESAVVNAELFIDATTSVKDSKGSKAIPVRYWGEHVTHFVWNKDATSAKILLKFGGESNIYIDDLEIYEGKYIKETEEQTDTDFREITPGSNAVNIYVDGDAASNGDGSLASPFNTIEAAQSYIRANNDDMTCDIAVNIKGGTYNIKDTIVMTEEDSGKGDHYVIYQPYGYNTENQENVVLSGGEKVTGWTLSEIDGVYKAPFEIDYIRNLYVNGKRAQRARYNEYVTPISWWDDTEDTLSTMDGFVIPGGIIKNPEKATNLEIYRISSFYTNWAVRGSAVADGENTILKMEQPYMFLHDVANRAQTSETSKLGWNADNSFRLENALEFLDEPGEWYYDAEGDSLYYMPRQGESITECEVVAPVTEELLTICGADDENRAENIIIRGLTFSHGAYKKTSRLGRANQQATSCFSVDCGGSGIAGSNYTTEGNINIFNAYNVSLSDNVIEHMGAVAVAMPEGVHNCELSENVIYDISSSAITVGTIRHDVVTELSIVPKNVLIKNNIMGKTGVEYGSDPALQAYYTNGLTISHNEVYDAAYSGICVGWDWTTTANTKRKNTIEYNRIYNHGIQCQDGGAIYTLGRQPGSVVRGNYVHSYEQAINGIYHDSSTAEFTTTGNVIDMPADSWNSGLHNQSNVDENVVTGNYVNVINTTKTNTLFCDNYTEQGATRSPEALSIRANAGLESDSKSIRNKIADYGENSEIAQIYLQTIEQKHQNPANIKLGETLTLNTLAESKNGEITELSSGLSYQVSDASVLSLEGNKVKAIADGISNVTVTDSAGNTAMMQVTVGDEVVSFEVLANKQTVKTNAIVNLVYRLKTKYTEYLGKPSKSEIESGDTSVLTVVTDGTVKALKEGMGTVTVSIRRGGFTAEGTASVLITNSGYRTFTKLTMNSSLTKEEILSALGGSETAKVSEKTYVEVLSAITERTSDEICSDIGNENLTKENMVAIMADTVVNVYGVAPMGDYELHQYTDREQINPSLVPKIALAYEQGLLSWLEVNSAFEPKCEMTAKEVRDFLYHFVRPEKSNYLRMDETRFSTYRTVTQWLTTSTYGGMYNKAKQRNYSAIGEKTADMDISSFNCDTDGTNNQRPHVAIDSGSLVLKINRTTTYNSSGQVLLNNIDYKPGKSYKLTFSAKVSGKGTSIHSNGINEISIQPDFLGTSKKVIGEINSESWTEFSVDINIPENAVYPLANNRLRILTLNTGTDDTTKYTVLFKDIVVSEPADAVIASSSIADGEENVVTPIDSIYIYTDSPIITSDVTAEKFVITGNGASIRDAEAIDEHTVRIGLSGIVTETSYTLTISGIKTQTGGMLNDTISWTTGSPYTGKSGALGFETSKTGLSGDAGIASTARSQTYANTGNSSFKATTTTDANLFFNSRYVGFQTLEMGKKYSISYWIYSPDKAMKTGMTKNGGSGSGVRFIELMTVPAGEWTRVSGVFTATRDNHIENDIFVINVYGNPGTCYVDDVTVSELVEYPITVHRPNIFKGGIPVNRVGAGNVKAEVKITGAEQDCEVWSVIAQYDDNNRMVRMQTSTDIVKALEDTTVVINLPDAQNLRTKIFFMDSLSFAPYNDAIVMDKIIK